MHEEIQPESQAAAQESAFEYNLAMKLVTHDGEFWNIMVTASVPVNHILAVTGNNYVPGEPLRIIEAKLFKMNEQAGGSKTEPAGEYIRGMDEKGVKVVLKNEQGKVLAESEGYYPS